MNTEIKGCEGGIESLSTQILNRACDIIECAENREMACDGPVGNTVHALTYWERDELFRLLNTQTLTESLLRRVWKLRSKRLRKLFPKST